MGATVSLSQPFVKIIWDSSSLIDIFTTAKSFPEVVFIRDCNVARAARYYTLDRRVKNSCNDAQALLSLEAIYDRLN